VFDDRQRIVILYSHPLLGEGIAQLLADEVDADVQLCQVDDVECTRAALMDTPDVVILERSAMIQATDLLHLAPSALLIDVGLDAGPTWSYHRDLLSSQPDAIIGAIRGRRTPGGPGTAVGPGTEPAGTEVAGRRSGKARAALPGART
jgi:hypothetical protein